jgi:hypothetical protein
MALNVTHFESQHSRLNLGHQGCVPQPRLLLVNIAIPSLAACSHHKLRPSRLAQMAPLICDVTGITSIVSLNNGCADCKG